MSDIFIIGNIEICGLSDMGINQLEVRVDTGAKTSSLHVDHMEKFTRSGKPWVGFDIHPDVHNVDSSISCEAPLGDIRRVKSSSGESEQRYFIKTTIRLNNQSWPIEIPLADDRT